MDESDSITPEVTAPIPAKTRTPAEQDQRIQNEISETAAAINAAKSNGVILTALAKIGYDDTTLTHGLALATTAQESFTRRQNKIGEREGFLSAVNAADANARTRYQNFREVVRIAFASNPGAQRALGVNGATPRDRDRFLTLAQTSYATAQQAPYAAELSRRSYDAAGIAEAIATLTNLSALSAAYTTAVSEAKDATEARNMAYKELRAWRTAFNRALKLVSK